MERSRPTTPITVVIPTFTGEDTIDETLNSILLQGYDHQKIEVVVVIDGPNKQIKKLVEAYKLKFNKDDIEHYRVHQFKVNRGRFTARMEGAKLASNKTLIFVDDRVILPPTFLSRIMGHEDLVVVPTITETGSNNSISYFMKALRCLIYKNSGQTYQITSKNFDASAKGTTCLRVDKELFLSSCRTMAAEYSEVELKNSSDDTRLLHLLVRSNGSILKSEITATYTPRFGLVSELRHTFYRGPKFVDYYFRPGTRYFKYLVLYFLLLLIIPVSAIFYPIFILSGAVLSLVMFIFLVAYMSKPITLLPTILVGASLTIISFGAGLIKGLVAKVV